jgi:periplasmic protein TonB
MGHSQLSATFASTVSAIARAKIGTGVMASVAIHLAAIAAVASGFAMAPRPPLNRPVVEVQIAASFEAPSPAPRDAPDTNDEAPSLGRSLSMRETTIDETRPIEIAAESLLALEREMFSGSAGSGNLSGEGRDTAFTERGGADAGAIGASRHAHSAGVRPDPYAYAVSMWIERHKRMPYGARQWSGERTTVVAFTLDRRGRISRAIVVRTSGDARLDAATLALLTEIAPFPRAPEDAAWTRRRFEVPVNYSWRG